jgi:hypothetical protein
MTESALIFSLISKFTLPETQSQIYFAPGSQKLKARIYDFSYVIKEVGYAPASSQGKERVGWHSY